MRLIDDDDGVSSGLKKRCKLFLHGSVCCVCVPSSGLVAFIKEIYFWGYGRGFCVLFYLHYVFVSLGRVSFVWKVVLKFVISHRGLQRLHFSLYTTILS